MALTAAKSLLRLGVRTVTAHLGQQYVWRQGKFSAVASAPIDRFGPSSTGFDFGKEYNVTLRADLSQFDGDLPEFGDTFTDAQGKHLEVSGRALQPDGISVVFYCRQATA